MQLATASAWVVLGVALNNIWVTLAAGMAVCFVLGMVDGIIVRTSKSGFRMDGLNTGVTLASGARVGDLGCQSRPA